MPLVGSGARAAYAQQLSQAFFTSLALLPELALNGYVLHASPVYGDSV